MENQDWNTAIAFQKEGKHKEAIELFNKLIEQGANPDLLHDRGVSYFHIGNKKKCLADFDSALNLQPDYSYRYSSRAFIKAAFKDTTGALEDYRKAVEMDPEDAVAQNNLGLLEEQMGWKDDRQKRFKIDDALNEILEENDIPKEEAQPNTSASNTTNSTSTTPSSYGSEATSETSSPTNQLSAMMNIFKSKKEFW
ncbi:MAG: tetratricopeptide repeat protein [Flavobacteriales bacterium]|nr:tetratricopeptide repeat protein [Flavobacteriales bacterium]